MMGTKTTQKISAAATRDVALVLRALLAGDQSGAMRVIQTTEDPQDFTLATLTVAVTLLRQKAEPEKFINAVLALAGPKVELKVSATAAARDYLRVALRDGQAHVRDDLIDAAIEDGALNDDDRALKTMRNAASQLGVIAGRDEAGRSTWKLSMKGRRDAIADRAEKLGR